MIKLVFSKLLKVKAHNDILAKDLPGTRKKSFSLWFGGAEIWFEHLDGMYEFTDEVMKKFIDDTINIRKPSSPSLIAINLDETLVNEKIVSLITDTYIENTRHIYKVVFIGLDSFSRKMVKKAFKKREGEYQFIVNYMNDFEKAKEWLVGR